MNPISRLSLKTAALIILLAVSASFAKQPDTSYTVRIDPVARTMNVLAELTLEDDRLYVAPIGANQFEDRWAKFIRDLKVSRTDGSRVTATADGEGNWKLDARKGDRVKLSYTVDLKHEDHEWSAGIDGASYFRDWGIFAVGRAFAVMNGEAGKDILLKFELPDGWKVSGSWRETAEGEFVASGNGDLSESMFFAGMHEEFSLNRGEFELLFALGGPDAPKRKEEFSKLADDVLDYYSDLFGGIPKAPPGTSLDKILVVTNPGASTDGEVIGKHISMILDTSGDPMGALFSRFIFAHEFFHLWNGKSFYPASTDEEWFKEGVSNYYTMKALRKAGVLSEEAMFGVMNGLFFQRYRSDEAYGKKAISEVSSGDDKHRHWGMIYGGGMFAGICRDVAIRKASGGEKSLDEVITGLFRDFGGSSEGYSRSDLVSRIDKLSKGSERFLNEHVYGAGAIPVDACLRDAGLDASITDGNLVIKRKAGESPEEKARIDAMFGGRR
ncbi:MAG: hypothetical protein IPM63_09185 [Acidobacteriota bacterium]|nr:MAG: hypothetical protein IPM63_09185 [Acidobacteriota bacterium]